MNTNADRREGKNMSATVMTVSKATAAPQYAKTAAGLLEEARTFFRDPENEKEFQEWKKTQKGGKSE